jgi:chorismate-pyruvate lyase
MKAMTVTDRCLQLAKLHIGSGAASKELTARKAAASSAYRTAVRLAREGDQAAARIWARQSLSYSVGVGHPDYLTVDAAT